MLRYLIALIPGIFLFFGFYFGNAGEADLLLRDFGRVSFFYFTLALMVTPVIVLIGKNSLAPYRRVFGVLAFLVVLGHAGIYFYLENLYHKAFIIPAHFKYLDVASGTIAFLIMAILAITSNDYSVRLLRGTWKKIQVLAYPLFLIAALHVAFASRFDGFYIVIIGLLIALRIAAYFKKDSTEVIAKPTNPSKKITKYLCVPCGYIYDEALGDPDGGIAPGTRFEDIPDGWVCPVCGVSKDEFIPYEENAPAKEDTKATITDVTLLNPTTLELTIETEKHFAVTPGQYARIALKDRDGTFYRSYSIVTANGKRLTFSIKLGSGRGGNILKTLKTGDILWIDDVYGKFVLQNTNHPKVFIATGTGLAPIMNMIQAIPDAEKILFFGVQDRESLFYTEKLKQIANLTSYIFLSREKTEGYQHGRIDLSPFEFAKETEFYICGNPALVEDSVKTLQTRGFSHIYHEKF